MLLLSRYLWLGVALSFFVKLSSAGTIHYDAFAALDHMEKGEFEVLDGSLKKLQKGYERGEYGDRVVVLAFYAFSGVDKRLEEKLSQWIKAYPESYAARLARGVHYVTMGFHSRGGAFAEETAEHRFERMRSWFEKASDDLMRALELNPRLTVAYRHLMRISMAGGTRQETKALFEQAMEVDPASYTAWYGYLFSLQPKWGGSMTEMGAAIRDMEKRISDNPELKPLTGYMQFALGDSEDVYSENDKGALYYYNKAVEKADGKLFLVDRGKAHYDLSNYEQALDDFTKALSNWPYSRSALYWRAKTHRLLGNNQAALSDFNKAVKLDYSDPDTRRNRGLVYWELKQWAEAIEDFSEALVFGDDTANHWQYRGRVYMQTGDYKKAVSDLRQAVKLDPDDEDHWYHLAVSLHRTRNCDIVEAVNRYMALCGDRECSSDKVEWAEKIPNMLRSRGICS